MNIDMLHFTPLAAIAGGALIGLSAASMILFNGRIAGISGSLATLLSPRQKGALTRLIFIAGLLLAPALYSLLIGVPDTSIVTNNVYLLIASGLLLGLGARYAAGCTSGHGVCGLARRSPRSFVATTIFMFSTFMTVYVTRHLL